MDEILEEMIDRKSLWEVLEALHEICYAKAEHLRANWQDTEAAREWERAGEACDKACAKASTLGL